MKKGDKVTGSETYAIDINQGTQKRTFKGKIIDVCKDEYFGFVVLGTHEKDGEQRKLYFPKSGLTKGW